MIDRPEMELVGNPYDAGPDTYRSRVYYRFIEVELGVVQ